MLPEKVASCPFCRNNPMFFCFRISNVPSSKVRHVAHLGLPPHRHEHGSGDLGLGVAVVAGFVVT